MRTIKIALTGNPNSGKSSLFNALTGLRQQVGNFPGVTVDKKTGRFSLDKQTDAEAIDLPGTYSLYPKKIDEHVTFDVLFNTENDSYPDVVVIVADASNLKRNLLFCSQIIDLHFPTVVALNMLDIADKNHVKIDIAQLSKELGVAVVPINAREGKGIDVLKKEIATAAVAKQNFVEIKSLAPAVVDEVSKLTNAKSDYTAFQIANNYMHLFCLNAVEKGKVKSIIETHQFKASALQGEEILSRYSRINSIIEKTVVANSTVPLMLQRTRRIDKVLMHPFFGYFIFLGILFVVFQAIFSWAELPMNLIDGAFNFVQTFLFSHLPAGWITDLLVHGILAGIGGIVVFIPQIMLLFGFVSVLEDSGYMARVSFMMDRMMRSIGLSGKSSIPLMSGMACAIPAIMSTRNIENWKDRIITIMVTPLMSCSARLPVYTLLIGFVVPDEKVFGVLSLKGLAMLGLYLLGFIMAIVASFVMKLLIKSKEKSFFMMELPLYRWPRWKNVGLTMLEKAKVFVTDAGKVIIAVSIVLWFLAAFGPGDEIKNIETQSHITAQQQHMTAADEENFVQGEKLTHSYAGHIGKFIEPAIAPLGFDWKIGIALITSFAAREVFVGTMSTIYSVGSTNETNYESLRQRMNYPAPVALSLIIFFAFAMQCMSTVAVVRRETKSWKWPLIQIAYMTVLAYSSSFFIYHIFS